MTKPREAFRCSCWEFKLRGMGLLVLVVVPIAMDGIALL